MDVLNPLAVRPMGLNINRDTVRNAERAGLRVTAVDDLKADVFKRIRGSLRVP
jgi:hypothetical protein